MNTTIHTAYVVLQARNTSYCTDSTCLSAVTRNSTEASGPDSAATEEAAPLGDFGDLIVEQADDNSTEIDTAPTPALHDALPAGQHVTVSNFVFQKLLAQGTFVL